MTTSDDFFDESFTASVTKDEEKGLGTAAGASPPVSTLIEKGFVAVNEVDVEEDAPKGLGMIEGATADKLSVFGAVLKVKGFVDVDVVDSGAFVLASEDSEANLSVSLLIAPIGIDGNENGAAGAVGVDELLIEPNTEELAIEGFASEVDDGRDDDDIVLENGFDNGKVDGNTFVP